jgi:diguanylate cyclase (GGDEF)-like protein
MSRAREPRWRREGKPGPLADCGESKATRFWRHRGDHPNRPRPGAVNTDLAQVRARSAAVLLGALARIEAGAAQLAACVDVGHFAAGLALQVSQLIACETVSAFAHEPDGSWRPVAAHPPNALPVVAPTELDARLACWVPVTEARAGRRVEDDGDVLARVAVPLTVGGHARLAIEVVRPLTSPFHGDDLSTLRLYAAFTAQAFVAAERVQRSDAQQAELRFLVESQRKLLEINEHLLSTLDRTSVLDLIAESLQSLVWHDSFTVFRVNRGTLTYEPILTRARFVDPDFEANFLHLSTSIEDGLSGWVLRNGEALCLADAHLDERGVLIEGTTDQPEQLIVAPLVSEGDVIGTLAISRMGTHEVAFTAPEFEVVKLFARQVSIALRNATVHRRVSDQAETDAMTGLLNHGMFSRHLAELVVSPTDAPFAMLMLDLDGFKHFNDTQGHPAGDVLLQRVAAGIAGAIRGTDRAYRYGGDEFAVLLLGAGPVHGADAAERVRAAIGSITGADRAHVTASVGVACYPDDAETSDELLAAADFALYQAKRGGGDAVMAAVPERPIRNTERRTGHEEG